MREGSKVGGGPSPLFVLLDEGRELVQLLHVSKISRLV